ncbi:ATP-binding protein [Haloimpatiens lingqiaonensis]|uniref:ATP-binding protein n=1 Tax=Haloimpatiens lingqiaonensis TaxID=1380675 RepID=UPI0010FD42F2|nr:ATP-binding protein [Haloimpatiens lingqiaonensis]
MINAYQSQILKMYESIRENEEKALKSRKEEVYNKIPKIDALEKEIARLSIHLSINILKDVENREGYLKNLKEKITDLRVQKTELLVSSGYPLDYLDMHYRCTKCNDTGFIGNRKCSCYKRYLIKLYYKNSDLETSFKKNNFDNFNLNLYSTKKTDTEVKSPRKNMEEIFLRVKSYLKSFSQEDTNLLFYGNSGTGKTFLSHCIAKWLIDRGNFVVYRTAKELIETLRDARFNENKTLEDLILNCDLLIIDDLGTEQITDFSKSELFNLINWKLLKGKKMLISTNLSLEELSKHYSERITSRLFGNFELYKFYGDDIRVKRNLKEIR